MGKMWFKVGGRGVGQGEACGAQVQEEMIPGQAVRGSALQPQGARPGRRLKIGDASEPTMLAGDEGGHPRW